MRGGLTGDRPDNLEVGSRAQTRGRFGPSSRVLPAAAGSTPSTRATRPCRRQIGRGVAQMIDSIHPHPCFRTTRRHAVRLDDSGLSGSTACARLGQFRATLIDRNRSGPVRQQMPSSRFARDSIRYRGEPAEGSLRASARATSGGHPANCSSSRAKCGTALPSATSANASGNVICSTDSP
jgi:hypothetical protein